MNRITIAKGAPADPKLITWEQAHRVAYQAAVAFRPPYFSGTGFLAHAWVVEAIRSAHMDGQLHAMGMPPIERGGEMRQRDQTGRVNQAAAARKFAECVGYRWDDLTPDAQKRTLDHALMVLEAGRSA